MGREVAVIAAIHGFEVCIRERPWYKGEIIRERECGRRRVDLAWIKAGDRWERPDVPEIEAGAYDPGVSESMLLLGYGHKFKARSRSVE